MANSAPLISVVIAVFNGSATIQQCLNSFVEQIYPNKELIVIDGGSNDGTAAILEANGRHISYWLSEPDHGIYNAWNKALPHVKGDWLCFLGADDYFWDAKVLQRMSAHLQKLTPEIRIAYGRIMVVDPGGCPLYPLGQPWARIKHRIKNSMCIPHPGVMHRSSLFAQHGRFDESFRIAADYEFLLRELPMADAFFIPDLIVAAMRQGGISSTQANLWLALSEIRRAQRMHGHIPRWPVKLVAITSVLLRLGLVKVLGEARLLRMINWSKRLSKQ